MYTSDEQKDEQKKNSPFVYCCQCLRLLFVQSLQRIRDRLENDQWQLAFALEDNAVNTSDNEPALRQISDYQALTPPQGHMWADPHVVPRDGDLHVFFEDLEFQEKKGRIATAKLTANGFVDCVLDEPHHLSYPFVFTHDEVDYMIPETASQRTVSLYKARNFPYEWEHHINLLEDIDAADSTLLQHDGWWWLFTNSMSHPSVDERDELMIYFSRDLLSSEWQAHPLSPTVTGVDRARMAGRLFLHAGQLYRPVQYGAVRYGYGHGLARIDVLSTTDYRETLVSRCTPAARSPWTGSHTFTRTNGVTLVDRLHRSRQEFTATRR